MKAVARRVDLLGRPIEVPALKATERSSANGQFLIESGIPCPPKKAKARRYPFGELKVGESFVSEKKLSLWKQGKANNAEFTQREIEGGRFRIWRVK